MIVAVQVCVTREDTNNDQLEILADRAVELAQAARKYKETDWVVQELVAIMLCELEVVPSCRDRVCTVLPDTLSHPFFVDDNPGWAKKSNGPGWLHCTAVMLRCLVSSDSVLNDGFSG